MCFLCAIYFCHHTGKKVPHILTIFSISTVTHSNPASTTPPSTRTPEVEVLQHILTTVRSSMQGDEMENKTLVDEECWEVQRAAVAAGAKKISIRWLLFLDIFLIFTPTWGNDPS